MPGEFDLIKHYLLGASGTVSRRRDGYPASCMPTSGVVLGAGDDAALLAPSAGKELAISVDTSIADVHFPHDASPDAIGYRALAVSLSDLAAMGAVPRWCLLALSLPTMDGRWAESFSKGFHRLLNVHDMTLIGGDVTRGELSASVTVIGEVDHGSALRRDGASAEEVIAVSGYLGSAHGGLRQWQQGHRSTESDDLLKNYLYPQPRIAAGKALRGLASAAMDISDGLLADLEHLVQASQVGAVLDILSLPVSPGLVAALGADAALKAAMYGGDDYELLFTLPQQAVIEASQVLSSCDCTLSVIGRTTHSLGITSLNGEPIASRGWDHFSAP